MVSAAGCSIAGNKRGTHLWIAPGWLELTWHASEKTGKDEFFFHTDHGIVGTRHAYVGLISSTLGKNAFVRGGDMCMGPEQGSDASIEVPPQRYFFAGGFAMEVEENDLGGDLAEEFIGFAERIVAGGHKHAALEVHDGVGLAGGQCAFVDSKTRSANGIVGGTDDSAATNVGICRYGHVLKDLFFIPDVIAGSDDVGTEIKEFFCDRGSNSETACGVFTVDYKKIDGVGFNDMRQVFADDMAAGGAKDVADEEDIHYQILHCWLGRARRRLF
jgi:hypothetical protein